MAKVAWSAATVKGLRSGTADSANVVHVRGALRCDFVRLLRRVGFGTRARAGRRHPIARYCLGYTAAAVVDAQVIAPFCPVIRHLLTLRRNLVEIA
jgi:hypothetical protein